MNKEHVQNSLARIEEIFEKASTKIESLKVGQKIPATALAEEIAKDYGMTGPQLYPTLLFLIKGYPGVEIKRGAHGGIVKLANVIAQPLSRPIQVEVKEDKVEDELDEAESFIVNDEDKTLPIINT